MVTLDDFANTRVTYAFFGRQGGVSTGVFSSLNCTAGQGDTDAAVRENRWRVLKGLGLSSGKILTLKQIHSDICFSVTTSLPTGAQGDALVTSTPGTVIGVLTADCAPVLFMGAKADGAPVIGAAHAGWGGAVRGVLEATIGAMVMEGAEPATLRAAIGPCIAKPSYEVSAGFEKPFLEDDPASKAFFTPHGEGKFLFDLPAYVKFRLNRAGVHKVSSSGHDTYSNEENWFSYRRSTHRQESQYGRQISAISIRNS